MLFNSTNYPYILAQRSILCNRCKAPVCFCWLLLYSLLCFFFFKMNFKMRWFQIFSFSDKDAALCAMFLLKYNFCLARVFELSSFGASVSCWCCCWEKRFVAIIVIGQQLKIPKIAALVFALQIKSSADKLCIAFATLLSIQIGLYVWNHFIFRKEPYSNATHFPSLSRFVWYWFGMCWKCFYPFINLCFFPSKDWEESGWRTKKAHSYYRMDERNNAVFSAAIYSHEWIMCIEINSKSVWFTHVYQKKCTQTHTHTQSASENEGKKSSARNHDWG